MYLIVLHKTESMSCFSYYFLLFVIIPKFDLRENSCRKNLLKIFLRHMMPIFAIYYLEVLIHA